MATAQGKVIEHSEPLSPARAKAVREQLDRVLASPLFRNSKRYPNLLRHVVERTLEGRTAELRERNLGVDVLKREPNYDTSLDPAVRITAGEIRKRLAQYYQEPGHKTEIRIDLPPGSYVPEFHLQPVPIAEAATPQPARARRRPLRKHLIAAAIGAAALAAVVTLRGGWPLTSALERFWGPVMDSAGPVLICIGRGPQSLPAQPAPEPRSGTAKRGPSLFDLAATRDQNLVFPDVTAISRLTGLLQAKGKRYHIGSYSSSPLSDLREGPVVLVGALNNSWTTILTGESRFQFEQDSPSGGRKWIRDRQDPASRRWSVDFSVPYLQVKEDYAVISRLFDPTIERMVVVAGGLAGFGTMAASDFLTNPAYMRDLASDLPRGWAAKNLQIVIATKVVRGSNGPLRVLATHVW